MHTGTDKRFALRKKPTTPARLKRTAPAPGPSLSQAFAELDRRPVAAIGRIETIFARNGSPEAEWPEEMLPEAGASACPWGCDYCTGKKLWRSQGHKSLHPDAEFKNGTELYLLGLQAFIVGGGQITVNCI